MCCSRGGGGGGGGDGGGGVIIKLKVCSVSQHTQTHRWCLLFLPLFHGGDNFDSTLQKNTLSSKITKSGQL